MADTKFLDSLKNKEVTIDDYGNLSKEGKNKIVFQGSYEWDYWVQCFRFRINPQKSEYKLLKHIFSTEQDLKNYFENQEK